LDRPELKLLAREADARLLGNNPYIRVSSPSIKEEACLLWKREEATNAKKECSVLW